MAVNDICGGLNSSLARAAILKGHLSSLERDYFGRTLFSEIACAYLYDVKCLEGATPRARMSYDNTKALFPRTRLRTKWKNLCPFQRLCKVTSEKEK